MNQYKINRNFQLDGMENQFLIGYINFMVFQLNINVKFVEIILIGVQEIINSIFRNGVMRMV